MDNELHTKLEAVLKNINKVLVGRNDAAKMVLAAVVARGHVLLEDKPGVGKTMLAKALSRSIGCKFSRIQFNADILPGDITGVDIYTQEGEFKFVPGPIMSNLVLVDEINRGNPRAQSGLLEAMEEKQVTVGEESYQLNEPFCVIATQNPLDLAGTFPLAEGLLDRFMVTVSLGYPDISQELNMLDLWQGSNPLDEVEQVIDAKEVIAAQEAVTKIYVEQSVKEYMVKLVQKLRHDNQLRVGLSPRATLDVYQLSRAWALLHGRSYTLPDDVKAVASEALSHRLFLKDELAFGGVQAKYLVEEALTLITVPVVG
ncbi:MoxR family ATPase [Metallumcola ferriviriculae]|uniref:MoxR family ATPase n=1 Tax=Metallumcola ferriviriculae TaxID=3039180 RepID=A0AAU0UQV7_9FIRM|nr:MoxR family ATPase [Desulfitibacteraceae bacterium MK1]